MMAQLTVTLGFVAMFVYEKNLYWYVQQHPELSMTTAFTLLIVVLVVLILCAERRRRWPVNIILLGLFTLCKSYMLGTIASYYRVNIYFFSK